MVAPSGVIEPNFTRSGSLQPVLLELADGEGRSVDGERRNDDVDARAIEQARIADRARLVDAAADLADDSLADVEELGVVAEADARLQDLSADFDEGGVGAVHHDVGDVVTRQQRLQRAEAQNIVADVLEQFFLLGDGHHHILQRDDLVDDVPDLVARGIAVDLAELRQVDGIDQRVEDRALDIVVVVGLAQRGLRLQAARCGCAERPRPGPGGPAAATRVVLLR